jgi:tetratricopeptide (TPR) repeat protein
MRGGISKQTLAREAVIRQTKRLAGVTLSMLLMAGSSYADLNFPQSGESSEQPAVVAVAKKPSGERSILVAKGTISEQPAPTPAKPRSPRRLEPISSVSQREPELAEPQVGRPVAPPDLADAPVKFDPGPVVEETPQRLLPAPVVEAEIEAEPIAETPLEEAPIVEAPVEELPIAEAETEPAPEAEPSTDEIVAPSATVVEAVTFHGITPGISVRSEVLSDWSQPLSADTTAPTLNFQFEGLKAVAVNFNGDKVESIAITLEKTAPVSEMIASMQLEGVRPVTISQESKSKTSRAYPERGVVLTLFSTAGLAVATDEAESSEDQVSAVLLEVVKPKLFLQRAKETAKTNLLQSIADLEQVVTLERKSPDAKYLLSCHNLAIGKAVTAERYAAEAVEIEPMNHEFRLQWAKCLGKLARYDRAVAEAKKVLELPGVGQLQRAEAMEEMGQLAALGSSEVSERAIQLHGKAIEIADTLANSEDAETRHAAQCVLIDAHLAIATQIAQGNFQDKNQAVPQWIERASALAEALIDEDSSYLPRRLQVAVSALAAATNLEKPINPKLWVEEAEETVKFLQDEAPDTLISSQYDWQLGLAYLHAADIEHLRSDAASAKKFGKLAEAKLSELARQRDELPDTGYTMGRLYFQIGAVYAVHEEDHTNACKWYDQAVDLLLNPVPVTTLAVPQQHGDALVSMGVSYWRTNDKERAVELTLAGVELIEEAVDAGLLGSTSLSVPYENLSAMYQALGKAEPAARYQGLARKISGNSEVSSQ